MFKGVYHISRYNGKLKTEFHKKYRVFDGIGSFNFDTLVEARAYVTIKSEQLKNLYNSSKSIYKELSACYLDKLVKFRIRSSENNIINECLVNIMDAYKLLSSEFFPQYALQKVRYIYNNFIKIAKMLKLKVLLSTIQKIYDAFFVEYPVYRSTDYQKVATKKSLNNNNNEAKKCII
ncbi:hypothetical protein [Dysgonomonas sp. 520]|uniref:hypothetical protein n=1 Tax=Dysgonomonas sp. 520 TaxID=2302931 RepID=UPI0013CF589F|nr:hypothetical protein [Dysgonomonas sp. 520]NDW09061.1 hypothetical protein [Dysgonomonas sp. 520]